MPFLVSGPKLRIPAQTTPPAGTKVVSPAGVPHRHSSVPALAVTAAPAPAAIPRPTTPSPDSTVLLSIPSPFIPGLQISGPAWSIGRAPLRDRSRADVLSPGVGLGLVS